MVDKEKIGRLEKLSKLIKYDFGKPPHTLVFPGKLHFMEAEALVELAGAPREIVKKNE